MDIATILTGSIGGAIGGFVLTRIYEAMSSDRKGAARIRAMLVDVDAIAELAEIYFLPDSPKSPAYRLPNTLLHEGILWFADGKKLRKEELAAFHLLHSLATEVNRCLDQLHAANVAAANATEFGGGSAWLVPGREVDRLIDGEVF